MITNNFGIHVGMSLALGLFWTGAALAAGPLFPGAQYYADRFPHSVSISDLNSDQVPDLAVVNYYSDNVSVLLGIGDGTFAAAVHYAVGHYPSSVGISDLNGDQVPDLAVANFGAFPGWDGSVSVLLGLGDGTFATAVIYATGEGSCSVAIGDLDGDQVPDLAVANANGHDVSVLPGVGNGTFGDEVSFPVSGDPRQAAIGDLNNDQVLDLAVVGHWGNVSVLLGHGDGTFADALHYEAEYDARSLAIGDLDGDQALDIVTANGLSHNVSVLLGLGDGTFADAVQYTAGLNSESVAIGDLDDNQVPDLAVADHWRGTVAVLLGLGNGTFASAVDYPAGEDPWAVAISDLNGNQVPDLVVADGASDAATVLLGMGDGSFAATVHHPTGEDASSVAISDLNNDEVPDLAVANEESDDLSVLAGLGDGSFAAAVNYPTGDGPRSVAIGDLDGNQVPDLAAANRNSNDVSVLFGLGDGTFTSAVAYSVGNSPEWVAIGDLNCDEALDLVVANEESDDISVLLGIGDGTYEAAVSYAAGDSPTSVAIGDLDGDQVPDLAVASMGSEPEYHGNIAVLLGIGDGSFAAAVRYDAGVRSSSVAISDLDGDQVPDLAVANFGVDPDYDGGVSVLLGVGDGTFTGEVNYATGEASSSVAIGDLDGDQTPDLAVANYWDYNVSVLLGLGDGTFTTAAHFAAGYKPQCVVIADLDGDLALDLAVANTWTYPGNGSVSVLLNQDDCNANGIRDECDIDCGPPGAACDVPGCGMSEDCTDNGVPDECDIADGTSDDCNENGVPDECDIANGTSEDANDNGIPDECEPGLDIKPGSCPNPLNRKSHGVLPVALLGTADIEATTIDVSSILLARADGVGSEVAPHEGPPGPHSVFEDVGTPFYGEWCDCHDLEGDGFVDLLMKFETHEVVEALELNDLDPGALVELIVSGNLLDGTAFTASDCIRLVPPGTAAGQLYVESTAPSAWIDASPLDETLDGGGFADFERVYPLTTVVTLTAEISLHGQSFVAWQIDGEMQEPGENTVQFVMDESMTVKALYRAPVFWLPWQMETETPLPGTEAP